MDPDDGSDPLDDPLRAAGMPDDERVHQLERIGDDLQHELGVRFELINMLTLGGTSLVVELTTRQLYAGGSSDLASTADQLERRVHRIVADVIPGAVVSVFAHGAR